MQHEFSNQTQNIEKRLRAVHTYPFPFANETFSLLFAFRPHVSVDGKRNALRFRVSASGRWKPLLKTELFKTITPLVVLRAYFTGKCTCSDSDISVFVCTGEKEGNKPFSKENGYLWTGPKNTVTVIFNSQVKTTAALSTTQDDMLWKTRKRTRFLVYRI